MKSTTPAWLSLAILVLSISGLIVSFDYRCLRQRITELENRVSALEHTK